MKYNSLISLKKKKPVPNGLEFLPDPQMESSGSEGTSYPQGLQRNSPLQVFCSERMETTTDAKLRLSTNKDLFISRNVLDNFVSKLKSHSIEKASV
jgi:hypothetical protein